MTTLQRYYRHHEQPEQAIATAFASAKQSSLSTTRYSIYLDDDGWFVCCGRVPIGGSTLLYGYVEYDTFVETDQF